MPDAPSERRRPGAFLALLALFLAVRVAFVAVAADVFFYAEELEKGTAAKALLDGVDVPWYRLPFHPYEGGGLVVSLLKATAFLAVGESLLAHKLVALFTSSLVFAAGWVLTRRHFGPRAAVVYGLLFTLAPYAFQKLSILSLGIHFEALAFVFVVLDRGLRVLRDAEPRRTDLVVLGLATGFGTYFSYQVAIAAVWVALAALLARRRLLHPRHSLPALGSCALGLGPWFAMLASVGGEVFDVHGRGLVSPGGLEALLGFARSTLALPADQLLLFWLFPVLALVAGAWLALSARPGERPVLAFLGGFAALWVVTWIVSGFVVTEYMNFIGVQRLAPLWGVGLVLVAGAVGGRLALPGRGRAPALVLAALLALGGARQAVAILAEGRPGEIPANLAFLARTKGLDYQGYLAKVLPRAGRTGQVGLVRRAQPWLALDEPARDLLLGDLAAASFARDKRGVDHLEVFARTLAPDEVDAVLLGAGPVIARAARRDFDEALSWTLAVEPAARRNLLLRALGRHGLDHHFPWDVEEEVAAVLERPAAEPYLEGVGHRVFRRFVLGTYGVRGMAVKPAGALEWIATLPTEARPYLVAGFERARAEYTLGRAE